MLGQYQDFSELTLHW